MTYLSSEAALQVQRQHYPSRRLDGRLPSLKKKSFPRRKVCGEFISATSLPLLQKLGIAEFYLAEGGPEVQRVALFAADANADF